MLEPLNDAIDNIVPEQVTAAEAEIRAWYRSRHTLFRG